MLVRKREKEIAKWIEHGDKALLVYGARQVGKTFLIRQCLEKSGCDFIEFNFIKQPDIVALLESVVTVEDLITRLSLFTDKPFSKGKTILFFDEIQEYKEIVTKIKFFVDEGSFRYILSGSLLGVEIRNLRSAPVGYVQSITMYPLDFEEFLQVFNVKENIFKYLRDAYDNRTPVDEFIHKKMMEFFILYLLVGGMPAAVMKYVETSSLEEVYNEHLAIIEQYKQDFTKYEEENKKLYLTQIYDLIPAQLMDKNKRFNFADIQKGLKFERAEDNFIWLEKAGVALPVFNASEPKIPLLLNKKSNLFKLFLSDVGMLTSMYGRATKIKILSGDTDINNGALYENVIAQELTAHDFKLYYFNSKKQGELDFVVEHNGEILPIEVKSGKNYVAHSALDNVLENEDYSIKEAYVFANCNGFVEGKVVYYPIYLCMFLQEEGIEFPKIEIKF